MNVYVIQQVRSAVTDDVVRLLAKGLGQPPQATHAVMMATLPALVAALMKRSAMPEGARSLYALLLEPQVNARIGEQLPQLIAHTAGLNQLALAGRQLIEQAIAMRVDPLSEVIARQTGATSQATYALVGIFGAMVLGVLKHSLLEAHAGSDALPMLLAQQAPDVSRQMNDDLCVSLGLGAVASLNGSVVMQLNATAASLAQTSSGVSGKPGASGKAGVDKVSVVGPKAGTARASSTASTNGATGKEESSRAALWGLLIIIIVVAAVFYVRKSQDERQNSTMTSFHAIPVAPAGTGNATSGTSTGSVARAADASQSGAAVASWNSRGAEAGAAMNWSQPDSFAPGKVAGATPGATSGVNAARADGATSGANATRADSATSGANAARADSATSGANAARADSATPAANAARADSAAPAANAARADSATSGANAARADSATSGANATRTASATPAANAARAVGASQPGAANVPMQRSMLVFSVDAAGVPSLTARLGSEDERAALAKKLTKKFGQHFSGDFDVNPSIESSDWLAHLDAFLPLMTQPGAELWLAGNQIELSGSATRASDNWVGRLREKLGGRYNITIFSAEQAVAHASGQFQAKVKALLAENGPCDAASFAKTLNIQVIDFSSGSTHVPASAVANLKASAQALKRCAASGKRVTLNVAGYSDNVGTPADNLRLSQMRAASVRAFLVSEGVPAGSLHAVGYGQIHPVASNDTEGGRFANRRIEFTGSQ
ncbi:OmpA family protein [Paraburkholderia hayleyella]|uniref:OmpA family protein n=1 Tax=Paraburkholderia hayleyella TaxID=2152889 RepID=UPI001580C907|nr:OmpA family protein [Paraburkholderia hayleyella]